MIPKIKRILYATDLSPNAEYAFRYAVNAAIQHDARIIVLHVLEMISATTHAYIEFHISDEQRRNIFEGRYDYAMSRIKKRLEILFDTEFTEEPGCAGRIESIELHEGFAAEEILTKAGEWDCDIIVMGTHGKGLIQHAFLGSTAKRVLRRTRKPVFIIPLPEGEIDITFHDE